MVETAFFDFVKIEVHRLNVRFDSIVFDGFDVNFAFGQNRHVVVVEVNDIVGVFYKRRCV